MTCPNSSNCDTQCVVDNKCQLSSWALVNARSINNKLLELHHFIASHDLQVLCVTETWLDISVPDSLIAPVGYNVFRCDRRTKGGGVAVFCRSDVTVEVVNVPPNFQDVEVVCIDIKIQGSVYRVIGYYRPPGSTATDLEYLQNSIKCFQHLCATHLTVVLMGDFNMPLVDWTHYSGPDTPMYYTLMHFVNNYGMHQYVREPTRGDKTLDIVLSSLDCLVNDLQVISPFSTNDHDSVIFSVNVDCDEGDVTSCENEVFFDYARADKTGLRMFLANVNWNSIFQYCFTLDECCEAFYGFMYQAIQSYVPVCHKSRSYVKRKGVRYPRYIQKLMAHKLFLWRKWKVSGLQSDHESYRQASRVCQQAVNKYHATIETNLIRKSNTGSFYNYVNRRLGTKSANAGSLKRADGLLTCDNNEKAEMFNNFFASVFTVDDGVEPDFDSRVTDTIHLSDIIFTPSIVRQSLKRLKPTTSVGPDCIPNFLLRFLAFELAHPLCHIFDFSFKCQQLPQTWKHAFVTPVFKSGSTCDVNNYRPISLTSTCCRVMERIINRQLLAYLLKYGLITKEQHGFIQRRSVCSNLLESLYDWTVNLESRLITDVVYIDFRKAFDSVSHEKLLQKLQAYGIGGSLLGWISSFLSRRTQSVKISDVFSSVSSISSGVPQGSVLGPVLFLLYVNDIVDIFSDLSVSCKLYADDVKLYSGYTVNFTNHDLSVAISRLLLWSKRWQLKVANEKCLVLRVTNHKCVNSCLHASYSIDGHALNIASDVRDLGVIVDSNLKFDKHISLAARRAHQRAGLILKCFHSRDNNLLMKAFCTYVRPIIEYCTPVWSPYYQYLIFKIENVQRAFTKRLFGMKKLNYLQRLKALDVSTLERRRLHRDLVLCYNICQGVSELSIPLELGLSVTRGNNFKLSKPNCSTNAAKYFYSSRIVNAWNSLQNTVVNASSSSVFRRQLETVNLDKFLIVV